MTLDEEITIAQQRFIPGEDVLAELKRELAMRRKCYPEWVQSGRLSAKTAAHRIVVLECVIQQMTHFFAVNQSRQVELDL
jgi:hypothetical protein